MDARLQDNAGDIIINYRQIDIQIERKIDRQIDRYIHIDGQINR